MHLKSHVTGSQINDDEQVAVDHLEGDVVSSRVIVDVLHSVVQKQTVRLSGSKLERLKLIWNCFTCINISFYYLKHELNNMENYKK